MPWRIPIALRFPKLSNLQPSLKSLRSECSCHLDVEPVKIQTGTAGEVVCDCCGQVWVAPGWRGDRLHLFQESPDPVEAPPPSADALDLWYRLGRTHP